MNADEMPVGKTFRAVKNLRHWLRDMDYAKEQKAPFMNHDLVDVARDYDRIVRWMERYVMRGSTTDQIDSRGNIWDRCLGCGVKAAREDNPGWLDRAHPNGTSCFVYRFKNQAFKGETVNGQGCHHCGGYIGSDCACEDCGYDVS